VSASHTEGDDFPQLTWDLLDEPTVTEFSSRSSWSNWPNVHWTASQFWDVVKSSATEDPSKLHATWHHLVMTAGNFKRQAPISLPDLPDILNSVRGVDDHMRFTIEVDGMQKTVERDNSESWEELTDIPGIGVATATTILSALWPGYHVIADRRDVGAAIGLAYNEASREQLLKSAGYEGEIVSWKRYQWFRSKVIARAKAIDVEPVAVERALYEIDLATRTNGGTPWRKYRRELCRVLKV